MPQSGTLTLWQPSTSVRVDHGLRGGADVPPYYDSMIAKLVAHGSSRDDARRKLLAALNETVIFGLRSNKDFLADCLAHPVFVAGQATTAFIEENATDLLSTDSEAEAQAAMLAAALLRAGPGIRLTHGYSAPMRLARGDAEYHPMAYALRDGLCRVEMSGREDMQLKVIVRNGAVVAFEMGGAVRSAAILADGDVVTVQYDGRCHDFRDLTYQPTITAEAAGGDGNVRASMNGNVVSVEVAVGDKVVADQKLVVVEAMKMEHTHSSTATGTVTAVNVEAGMQVSTHTVLVEIEVS
ncbi:biotin/lipoyl-containing protein [Sulfitobacter porphyrae]|uniref:Biotin/lipoyl-containing protein n=1 Tax=Sulfitobacter porphyrae TaxID=1246864 RepID=A0ABW2B7G8_9RHOB